jgi:dihydroorotase
VIAVKKAIALAEKYRVRLCILHLSTQEELELVKRAKDKHLHVYAEVAPHHLFFNQSAYRKWGNLVQMNPPLRDQGDQEALWQGVQDGTVDFLGTDHAPHTLTEKQLPYGKAPSGVPGVELLLPLMATACVEGRLSFKRLIELTKTNIERIFQLPANPDWVWIDLKTKHTVNDHELRTKVKWSPYAGMQLTGWPVYTLCQDALFQTKDLQCLTQ